MLVFWSQSNQFQPTSIYGDQLLENPKFRNEITGEFNHQILEQKLRKQQKESEEDSKWLAESETNLVSWFFRPLSTTINSFYLFFFLVEKTFKHHNRLRIRSWLCTLTIADFFTDQSPINELLKLIIISSII